MSLRMEGISYRYPKEQKMTLQEFDLEIEDGMIYSLLGGSGSGKTTALNLVTGFLLPNTGRVFIKGKDVTRQRIHKRNIGMVFQEYALFPHMNVESNVGFGLRTRNVRSKEVKSKVMEVLELVGLGEYRKKYPSELSGGERQRVALSRALVYEPDLLLLDEPLSALDASLREDLRKDLRSILKKAGITALYVTHDQMEAIAVSDRIGYLRGGKIFEEGTPEDMFWKPERSETSRFMGISNIIDVTGSRNGNLETQIGEIPWNGKVPSRIGFRPSALKVEGDGIPIQCNIISKEYRGKEVLLDLKVGDSMVRGSIDGRSELNENAGSVMFLDTEQLVPLDD